MSNSRNGLRYRLSKLMFTAPSASVQHHIEQSRVLCHKKYLATAQRVYPEVGTIKKPIGIVSFDNVKAAQRTGNGPLKICDQFR